MSALLLNENIILNDEKHHIILNDDIIYEVIKRLKNDSFAILWKNPFHLCKSSKGYYLIVQAYITHPF